MPRASPETQRPRASSDTQQWPKDLTLLNKCLDGYRRRTSPETQQPKASPAAAETFTSDAAAKSFIGDVWGRASPETHG
ncbi:hypothetical protein Bca4012_087590 [Brassica carinata]